MLRINVLPNGEKTDLFYDMYQMVRENKGRELYSRFFQLSRFVTSKQEDKVIWESISKTLGLDGDSIDLKALNQQELLKCAGEANNVGDKIELVLAFYYLAAINPYSQDKYSKIFALNKIREFYVECSDVNTRLKLINLVAIFDAMNTLPYSDDNNEQRVIKKAEAETRINWAKLDIEIHGLSQANVDQFLQAYKAALLAHEYELAGSILDMIIFISYKLVDEFNKHYLWLNHFYEHFYQIILLNNQAGEQPDYGKRLYAGLALTKVAEMLRQRGLQVNDLPAHIKEVVKNHTESYEKIADIFSNLKLANQLHQALFKVQFHRYELAADCKVIILKKITHKEKDAAYDYFVDFLVKMFQKSYTEHDNRFFEILCFVGEVAVADPQSAAAGVYFAFITSEIYGQMLDRLRYDVHNPKSRQILAHALQLSKDFELLKDASDIQIELKRPPHHTQLHPAIDLLTEAVKTANGIVDFSSFENKARRQLATSYSLATVEGKGWVAKNQTLAHLWKNLADFPHQAKHYLTLAKYYLSNPKPEFYFRKQNKNLPDCSYKIAEDLLKYVRELDSCLIHSDNQIHQFYAQLLSFELYENGYQHGLERNPWETRTPDHWLIMVATNLIDSTLAEVASKRLVKYYKNAKDEDSSVLADLWHGYQHTHLEKMLTLARVYQKKGQYYYAERIYQKMSLEHPKKTADNKFKFEACFEFGKLFFSKIFDVKASFKLGFEQWKHAWQVLLLYSGNDRKILEQKFQKEIAARLFQLIFSPLSSHDEQQDLADAFAASAQALKYLRQIYSQALFGFHTKHVKNLLEKLRLLREHLLAYQAGKTAELNFHLYVNFLNTIIHAPDLEAAHDAIEISTIKTLKFLIRNITSKPEQKNRAIHLSIAKICEDLGKKKAAELWIKYDKSSYGSVEYWKALLELYTYYDSQAVVSEEGKIVIEKLKTFHPWLDQAAHIHSWLYNYNSSLIEQLYVKLANIMNAYYKDLISPPFHWDITDIRQNNGIDFAISKMLAYEQDKQLTEFLHSPDSDHPMITLYFGEKILFDEADNNEPLKEFNSPINRHNIVNKLMSIIFTEPRADSNALEKLNHQKAKTILIQYCQHLMFSKNGMSTLSAQPGIQDVLSKLSTDKDANIQARAHIILQRIEASSHKSSVPTFEKNIDPLAHYQQILFNPNKAEQLDANFLETLINNLESEPDKIRGYAWAELLQRYCVYLINMQASHFTFLKIPNFSDMFQHVQEVLQNKAHICIDSRELTMAYCERQFRQDYYLEDRDIYDIVQLSLSGHAAIARLAAVKIRDYFDDKIAHTSQHIKHYQVLASHYANILEKNHRNKLTAVEKDAFLKLFTQKPYYELPEASKAAFEEKSQAIKKMLIELYQLKIRFLEKTSGWPTFLKSGHHSLKANICIHERNLMLLLADFDRDYNGFCSLQRYLRKELSANIAKLFDVFANKYLSKEPNPLQEPQKRFFYR